MFLQSEDWKTIRSEALANQDGHCFLCKKRSISNDAHHIFYRENIWETKADDLIILCRPCHDFLHSVKSLGVNNKLSDESGIRKLREFVDRWLYGLGGIDVISERVSKMHALAGSTTHGRKGLKKERRNKACKLCRNKQAPAVPRNIFAHYGIEQSLVMWNFCDACFKIFTEEMKWPTKVHHPVDVFRKANLFLERKRTEITSLTTENDGLIGSEQS